MVVKGDAGEVKKRRRWRYKETQAGGAEKRRGQLVLKRNMGEKLARRRETSHIGEKDSFPIVQSTCEGVPYQSCLGFCSLRNGKFSSGSCEQYH